MHHLAASPSLPQRRSPTGQDDLSTVDAPIHPQPVDELPQGSWLGYVVPKRHARRAVTRVLLKRQIRQIFGEAEGLPPGLWVVRLRAPFDVRQFPSASSDALRAAARAELLALTRKVAPPPAAD